MKHKPTDTTGNRIRVCDTVKVIGVPDLTGMAAESLKESLPVFEHIVGKYKMVEEFDEYGFAWLRFVIRKGPSRGWHSVAIEPFLLRVRRPQKAIRSKGRSQTKREKA